MIIYNGLQNKALVVVDGKVIAELGAEKYYNDSTVILEVTEFDISEYPKHQLINAKLYTNEEYEFELSKAKTKRIEKHREQRLKLYNELKKEFEDPYVGFPEGH